MSGKLYMVPTPIGNLGDITLRALEILKSVDYILAEDTRVTQGLLQHYQITTPLRSFHQNNEHRFTHAVMDDLRQGRVIAQVTDAGTPGISDPGYMLAHACREAGLAMECLPGAVAFIPALVKSGFPMDEFVFAGFLPHKKGRQTALKNCLNDHRTIILYESPHRLLKLLESIQMESPRRTISVSRELTKKFEETLFGTAGELAEHFIKSEPRGEFVVILEAVKKIKHVESD